MLTFALAATRMNFKQKDIHCKVPLARVTDNRQIRRDRKQKLPMAEGKKEWAVTVKGLHGILVQNGESSADGQCDGCATM